MLLADICGFNLFRRVDLLRRLLLMQRCLRDIISPNASGAASVIELLNGHLELLLIGRHGHFALNDAFERIDHADRLFVLL